MKIKNNDQGGTFMLVIIGFAVLFMISMVAIFITISNTKQTVIEENRIQSYYLAQTGAQAFVDHIQSIQKKPIDGVSGIQKLENLSKIKQSERNTYEEVDGYFVIKVKSKGEDKYEVITTATVGDSESTLVAVINGVTKKNEQQNNKNNQAYNDNKGRMYINKIDYDGAIYGKDKKDTIQIKNLRNFEGEGIKLFTGVNKYADKVPFHVNDGDLNKLFEKISSKTSVSDLNEEKAKATDSKKGEYNLKIQETSNGGEYVNKDNFIKKERLYHIADKKFAPMEFNYGLTKDEVLNYFSAGSLNLNSIITEDQLLERLFLLPIQTKENLKAYKDGDKLFPSIPEYKFAPNLPKSKSIEKGIELNEGKEEKEKKKYDEGDLANYKNININKIRLKNTSILNLKFSEGITNVFVEDSIITNDSDKKNEMNIETNGIVNFYIKGVVDLSGDINVIGSGQVNFYMQGPLTKNLEDGAIFKMNNKSVINGINLYAPDHRIVLDNDIYYEGLIIANHIKFNDTAIFKNKDSKVDKDNSHKGDSDKNDGGEKDLIINWQNTTEAK